MQGKVEICGVNTAKLKVLKNEETRALLVRAKAGDMAAREELIAGNLRLVLSVIQKFSGRGENIDDLFQVGCIGLIKAVDNFDITQQVRFSTYGVPMVIEWRNPGKRGFPHDTQTGSIPCNSGTFRIRAERRGHRGPTYLIGGIAAEPLVRRRDPGRRRPVRPRPWQGPQRNRF